jgi:hypothetical protein
MGFATLSPEEALKAVSLMDSSCCRTESHDFMMAPRMLLTSLAVYNEGNKVRMVFDNMFMSRRKAKALAKVDVSSIPPAFLPESYGELF